jgi:predicted nucleotidyltransferase
MGTTVEVISNALFGETRRAVLALLFGRPEEEFYLREVIRAAGVGQGAVQRELRRLVAAGLVTRRVRGRQVYFRANPDSPVYEELRGLLLKTAGAVEVLRSALAPLVDRIRFAFIYGSVARGDERRASDLDLLVVGDVSLGEVVKSLGRAQERLGREVNPTVFSEDEFRSRITAGRHFLKKVMAGAKVFVVGDERDAGRLGQ